jgi:hypothetical protein
MNTRSPSKISTILAEWTLAFGGEVGLFEELVGFGLAGGALDGVALGLLVGELDAMGEVGEAGVVT